MSLWRRIVSEAHRRSLWQVLGIYLVGSWIGFQVVLALVQGIGLPEWLPGVAAALFVIGLPVVLATAFVQEGGPVGAATSLDPTLFPDATPASAPPVSRLRRVLTWRRSMAAGFVAFALLTLGVGGLLGMRSVGFGPWASLLAAERIGENDRVLIAEFEPRGADSALATVVSDAFRIDFARSTLVRAVTPSEIRDALRRMGRDGVTRIDEELARQIAERDGISAYVTGDVTAMGGGYMLSARLISTASGELLAAFREKARDDNALIDAVDRLSRDLRRRTGESLRTVQRAEPLAKVTTSSIEALRYYTQGGRASSWDGQPDRARELHERAIELDTAFAASYRALAIYYSNRYDRDRAITYAEKALRHRDRMTESEYFTTQATLHLARTEWAEAAAALERVVQLEPRNFSALNNLGMAYSAMDDDARAEDYYRRSAALDTTRFFAFANLGEQLIRRNRIEEAEQVLRRAASLAPQSSWPVVAVAQVPYSAGNHAEAEKRLRSLISDPTNNRAIQERATERLYFLHRVGGRMRESELLLERQVAAGAAAPKDMILLHADRAFNEVFVFERPAEARRHATAMQEEFARNPSMELAGDLAFTCAIARDMQCVQRVLQMAGEAAELKPWSTPSTRLAHAAMARANGDLPSAIRIMRDLRDPNCRICVQPFIGFLFDEMNQPDSAAAAYEKYISSSDSDRIFVDVVLAPLHEKLGRYYEGRGDTARALQNYARVIELWKDADPLLQPRVRSARERIARLQPDH